MLNRIWLGFFLIAFLTCLVQATLGGQPEIFAAVVDACFKAARLSVDVAIGLTGLLCLWLGLFQIAERAGLIERLGRWLTPLFQRLMPEVPAGHPAIGAVTMNLAANMLGLDNAATPLGLKAMRELQSLNPTPHTATNAQILFLVLNTASVTLIPVTVFLYRAQFGAANPASVFLPILIAGAAGTLAGLLLTAWIQKLPIWDRVVLAYLGGMALVMGGLVAFVTSAPPELLGVRSALVGNLLLLSVIVVFLLAGWRKGIDVYETFVIGAKQGFEVAVGLIPYLVAMLVAIAVFRASGALDALLRSLGAFIAWCGLNTDFVPALPTAFMKSLSGSGARALMLETFQHYGVDSFPGRVAAIIQGSSETTFYVLAVYFGAVGIRHERHALACGLFADFVSVVVAILVAYWFFH
ncbi:MAG TPA: nucleoside recognition domain-containing protein [Moraxellaceae bacterium]|nr:nucleoside recognition domain-containing protein [Moraxellaceae bacterium]